MERVMVGGLVLILSSVISLTGAKVPMLFEVVPRGLESVNGSAMDMGCSNPLDDMGSVMCCGNPNGYSQSYMSDGNSPTINPYKADWAAKLMTVRKNPPTTDIPYPHVVMTFGFDTAITPTAVEMDLFLCPEWNISAPYITVFGDDSRSLVFSAHSYSDFLANYHPTRTSCDCLSTVRVPFQRGEPSYNLWHIVVSFNLQQNIKWVHVGDVRFLETPADRLSPPTTYVCEHPVPDPVSIEMPSSGTSSASETTTLTTTVNVTPFRSTPASMNITSTVHLGSFPSSGELAATVGMNTATTLVGSVMTSSPVFDSPTVTSTLVSTESVNKLSSSTSTAVFGTSTVSNTLASVDTATTAVNSSPSSTVFGTSAMTRIPASMDIISTLSNNPTSMGMNIATTKYPGSMSSSNAVLGTPTVTSTLVPMNTASTSTSSANPTVTSTPVSMDMESVTTTTVLPGSMSIINSPKPTVSITSSLMELATSASSGSVTRTLVTMALNMSATTFDSDASVPPISAYIPIGDVRIPTENNSIPILPIAAFVAVCVVVLVSLLCVIAIGCLFKRHHRSKKVQIGQGTMIHQANWGYGITPNYDFIINPIYLPRCPVNPSTRCVTESVSGIPLNSNFYKDIDVDTLSTQIVLPTGEESVDDGVAVNDSSSTHVINVDTQSYNTDHQPQCSVPVDGGRASGKEH